MEMLKSIKKRKIIISFFLTIISSFNGVMISQIIVQAGNLSNKPSKLSLLIFTAGGIAAWIIVYTANYLFEVVKSSIIKDLNVNLKRNYFMAEYFKSKDAKNYSEIISRISNDMKIIENNLFEQIFIILSNVIMFFVSLIYMLYLNTLISLIFIAFAVIPMIVPKVMGKMLTASANKLSLSNILYSKAIKEIFGGYSLLKNYNVKSGVFDMHENKLLEAENSNFDLKVTESKSRLFSAIISGFCFIIPFAIGCYISYYNSNISITIIIGIFLANDKVIGPIQIVVGALNKISTTKDLWKEVSSSLPDMQSEESRIEQDVLSCPSKIEMVCFNRVTYEINDNHILFLNDTFKCPFKILLVGASGSGKTTIFNLIKNRLSANSGQILFKDRQGTDINKGYNLVSLVSQNPYIFDTSLKNNITLFQNELFDDDEVYKVLRKMNLDIELNYETKQDLLNHECGDNGKNLSGGQKQKIEIARALIRKQQIFLLDELVANLDKDNAKKIHDLLFKLDISFIEVAHHFDIDDHRYTDIYKLEGGKLWKEK